MRLDIAFDILAAVERIGKRLARALAADAPVRHRADDRAQRLAGKHQVFGQNGFFLHHRHRLAHDPVGSFLRLAADRRRPLKQVGHRFFFRQDPRVIFRQAKFLLIAGSLCFCQFWLTGAHRVDKRL